MSDTGRAASVKVGRNLKVFGENRQFHCTVCKSGLYRALIIDGKPYCSIHAYELTGGQKILTVR